MRIISISIESIRQTQKSGRQNVLVLGYLFQVMNSVE